MLSILLKLGFGLLLFKAIVIHGDDDDDNDDSGVPKDPEPGTDEYNFIQMDDLIRCHHEQNLTIGDLFLPVEDRLIHRNKYGAIFKGIHINHKFEVAMKLVRKEFSCIARNEYEMYTYLKATCNETDVEKFGIAKIYYYDENFCGYFLLIHSYFGGGNIFDNQKYFDHKNGPYSINILILLRDFVRLSKYMYSCRVKHNNITPEHIVARKGQCFLINFNRGSKTNFSNPPGSLRYASRRTHNKQLTTPMCDWESFLYSLFAISHVELGWFSNRLYQNLNAEEVDKVYKEMKNEINITSITKIIKNSFQPRLHKVLIEFSKEIFEGEKPIPDYDRLYESITKVIDGRGTYTWNAGISEILSFISLRPAFNIKKDIVLLPEGPGYVHKYPEVNYNQFTLATTNTIT